jgi:gluconolactonase
MKMMMPLVLISLFCAATCSSCKKSVDPGGKSSAGGDIVAADAAVLKLAGGFGFTEGPTADSNGNVYFTDQPNDQILKWSVDGVLSVFMKPCQRSNGMEFDAEGNLISCADERNRLVSIDTAKNVTVLADKFNGKALNGPNDVWIDPKGGYYITDPYYQRPWWDHSAMPQDKQCVYYLLPDLSRLIRVIDDFVQPNGIVGTPDGKILYVADIGASKTWAYDIQPTGSLANKRLLASEGSDGMTMDSEGNVYLTNRSVVSVFSAGGKKIKEIAVPEAPANVAFGGADGKTLFITARTSLYSIRMRVSGK